MLDGAQGEVMAKVMRSLVMYGETFGAEKMVPVTSRYGHTVISFGIGVMKPVYELYDKLLEAGAISKQQFSADPLPLDPKVPSNLLQDIIFKGIMYSQQKRYEAQLEKFGILGKDAFTCACYLDEVGNKPEKGEVLSWAESSAVVYANSVLGARCNRNSGMLELMGSIAGCVPYFGLLTDDGRRADWIIEGTEITPEVTAYLKDFGAATASNGAVGLYHIENLTPEAKEQGESLIREGAPVYVIDDAELERVKANYPCVWKDLNAAPKLCFVGCPHLTLGQLRDWTENIERELRKNGKSKVTVPTVFTAAPATIKEFQKTVYAKRLERTGVILSYICPLMYMNNPLSGKMPVITCSNKLRTYTTARYYTEAEILNKITGGVC